MTWRASIWMGQKISGKALVTTKNIISHNVEIGIQKTYNYIKHFIFNLFS